MKKKKIKFILFPVIVVVLAVVGFKYVEFTLGNKNSYLAQNIKKLIPIEVKKYLKENIFIVKNLKNEIKFQKDIINTKDEQINSILDEIYNEKDASITFRKILDKNILLKDDFNFQLKKYNTNLLVHGKWHRAKGTSYLNFYNGKLFLVSGNGYFAFSNFDFYQKDIAQFKLIKSNIKDLIKQDEFYKSSLYGIKGIEINHNKIYISLTYEKKKNCFNTAIFYANLNLKKLIFEKFFDPDECVKKREKDFQPAQSGGKMIIHNNKLILSVGDWRYRGLAQNKKSVFGKIIEINLKDKSYKILSMGHRNPQGLSLNEENKLIVNTEHGPQGGDEINFNKNYNTGIKNFGWPISSYGEHYGFQKRDDDHQIYKKFPLYKSHKKYNFIEPVKFYVPSIAISQIVELNNPHSNDLFYVIGALGDTPEVGQMSLHFLKIDKDNFEIKEENIFQINERVRDIIFLKEEKIIAMFLETTASIGLIKINN